MPITMDDYTPELAEIAQISESGCATFDISRLPTHQQEAVQHIIEMNHISNWGVVEYGPFVVRIINNSLWRFVTVMESIEEVEPNSVY